MKKHLILGLILAAITITFTACGDSGKKSSSPVINKAFLALKSSIDDNSDDIKDAWKTTTISLKQESVIVFDISDDDKDVDVIYMSLVEPKINDDIFQTWPEYGVYCDPDESNWWDWINLCSSDSWILEAKNASYKTALLAANKIYVFAVDKEGNKSNVYEITGLTFTE